MLAEALMEYETLGLDEMNLAISGKKGEIQERHRAMPKSILNEEEGARRTTDLNPSRKAINRNQSNEGGGVQNSTQLLQAGVKDPRDNWVDGSSPHLCAVPFLLIALIGCTQIHCLLKRGQALQEPLIRA